MNEIGCPNCGRPVEVPQEKREVAARALCSNCGAGFAVAEGIELGAETAVLQREQPHKGAMLDIALVGHLRVTGSMNLDAPSALRPGKTIVGREDADIVVFDSTLSARHFEIENRDGRFLVRDLGSTNGTRVNGEPLVGTAELEDGDRIEAGKTKFVFRTLETVPWKKSE